MRCVQNCRSHLGLKTRMSVAFLMHSLMSHFSLGKAGWVAIAKITARCKCGRTHPDGVAGGRRQSSDLWMCLKGLSDGASTGESRGVQWCRTAGAIIDELG